MRDILEYLVNNFACGQNNFVQTSMGGYIKVSEFHLQNTNHFAKLCMNVLEPTPLLWPSQLELAFVLLPA
jgi:hypothetical protein